MKQPNLEVNIKGVRFKNPVLVASGTFGYAKEFERFFDVRDLGGIVTKTITLKPRLGNPPQRVTETPGGMLNAIGLQNVGVEAFIKDKLPYLASLQIPIIVSVMGHSVKEFEEVVRALEGHEGIHGFELNLSCPNVPYQEEPEVDRPAKMFAHDAKLIEQVVKKARGQTDRLLIAKLGPDVSDIAGMALACEKGGADAVSLINTFIAMAIDIKTRRPVIQNVTGGLSGPCIRPIAVRMAWEVHNAVKIPVIGMGGISSCKDVVEFLIAGASLVQVGTMNFVNPRICPEIIQGLGDYLRREKIASVQDLVGSLKT